LDEQCHLTNPGCFGLNGATSGNSLLYLDPPNDSPGTQIDFETFLIADFGNRTYDTLVGFSWSVEMIEKTKIEPGPIEGMSITITESKPRVTKLEPGAVFTREYADLIEQQFGYEKVLKLPTYSFSDALSPGQVDSFAISNVVPNTPFLAWTDNFPDLNPRRTPDTWLGLFDNSGILTRSNDEGGPLQDNWGSGLKGFVGNQSNLNFKVTGYPDRDFDGQYQCNPHPVSGTYQLLVKLYDSSDTLEDNFRSGFISGQEPDCPPPPPPEPEPDPCETITLTRWSVRAGYGGECDNSGFSQQDPILPDLVVDGWQIFDDEPSNRWFDPPTPYGFEFQALGNTLFTSILDFPLGDDRYFSVSVGDNILGEFSPGNSVDFVSLFGSGVSSFKITDIDSPFGPTAETAFPIKLAFNNDVGSFKMRPIARPNPQPVPESSSIFSLLALGIWGASSLKKRK
jgi:hypothetical protein